MEIVEVLTKEKKVFASYIVLLSYVPIPIERKIYQHFFLKIYILSQHWVVTLRGATLHVLNFPGKKLGENCQISTLRWGKLQEKKSGKSFLQLLFMKRQKKSNNYVRFFRLKIVFTKKFTFFCLFYKKNPRLWS